MEPPFHPINGPPNHQAAGPDRVPPLDPESRASRLSRSGFAPRDYASPQEKIRIATKILDRRERNCIHSVLDYNMGSRRKSGDAMSERSDEVINHSCTKLSENLFDLHLGSRSKKFISSSVRGGSDLIGFIFSPVAILVILLLLGFYRNPNWCEQQITL